MKKKDSDTPALKKKRKPGVSNSSAADITDDNRAELTTLPLLPLRDVVVFPYMVLPLFVGRAGSVAAVEEAMANDHRIFVGTQKDAKVDEPTARDIYRTGVICEILQLLKLPDGNFKIIIEGITRASIRKYSRAKSSDGPVHVHVETTDQESQEDIDPIAMKAMMRNVTLLFEQYIKLNQKIPVEIMMVINNTDEPSRLADIIIAHLGAQTSEKQKILEIIPFEKRLRRLSVILERELKIMKLEKKIRGKVKERIEKFQKEYYLREQLKTIKEELGYDDDQTAEIEELREKISAANLPDHVREKAEKELGKLDKMMPGSAEGTVIRNYLDWILDLPWQTGTEDTNDIIHSRQVLDEDHFGLDDVKDRIVEHLAVCQLKKDVQGQILCFSGPPGVGKTSLGRSIARALGRNFARMSLGGVRDEAEIRGHRRTYIGALPGRILQMMKKAKSENPVLLLDEVDKLSSDFRGDPSSALLEVLDPEQNREFEDHYLNLPYDLSNVMFILTANVLHTIPPALRDRMEIINLPGYTEVEKAQIAVKYLIPRQKEKNGLQDVEVNFPTESVFEVIRYYTREAGVRTLEKRIATLMRKTARSLLEELKPSPDQENPLSAASPVIMDSERIRKFLGSREYLITSTLKEPAVGVAMGMAWTATGGDVLPVETVAMAGKGKLILTGKLGDVMKESAQAGYSYIRARGSDFGVAIPFHEKRDIHIHFPEGAIPKDGPSAGVTIATSLLSELTGRPVRRDVAMTGEITLRGTVLPVGGIKEKVLAAHRAGVTTVILPEENRKDWEEIPEEVRDSLEFHFVEHVSRVFEIALLEKPAAEVVRSGSTGVRQKGRSTGTTDRKAVKTATRVKSRKEKSN